MTSEQLADILSKADDVHSTKVAYDAAVAANNTAIAAADAAAAAWRTAVNAGNDETTLTNYLEAYVAAGVVRRLSDTAREGAGAPYSMAQGAMEAAVNTIIDESMPSP